MGRCCDELYLRWSPSRLPIIFFITSGSVATCEFLSRRARRSRGSTRSCRRTSPACRRCSCSGRAVNYARFDTIDSSTATPTSTQSLLRGLLPGDRGGEHAGGGVDHLPAAAASSRTLSLGALVAFLRYRSASGRSATCRRSSTSCRRRWRHPSIFALDEPVAIESPSAGVPAGARGRAHRVRQRLVRLQGRGFRAEGGPSTSARPARRHRRRHRIGKTTRSTCCCASTT